MPASAPYAAAKAALHAWVRALSREVKDRGVHANVIMTSRIDTPARRALFPDADYSTWVSGDDLAALASLTSRAAAAAPRRDRRRRGDVRLRAASRAVGAQLAGTAR